MTGHPPLIRCERVTKQFGGKRVLRDVSLSVAAGEILSLLGANGSGKTTLLRIVAGLERPDGGEVWLGPVPLSAAHHEIRRYIGVVAHAPLLYDRLTAAENLRFFARMYDLAAPEDRITRLLHATGLWSRAATTLSAPSAAACSSGSPSPAPSCTTRLSWSSTSRIPAWTAKAFRCWPACWQSSGAASGPFWFLPTTAAVRPPGPTGFLNCATAGCNQSRIHNVVSSGNDTLRHPQSPAIVALVV